MTSQDMTGILNKVQSRDRLIYVIQNPKHLLLRHATMSATMSRPPINPEKSNAGIITDPHTLQRVIPESKRPDGSYVRHLLLFPNLIFLVPANSTKSARDMFLKKMPSSSGAPDSLRWTLMPSQRAISLDGFRPLLHLNP